MRKQKDQKQKPLIMLNKDDAVAKNSQKLVNTPREGGDNKNKQETTTKVSTIKSPQVATSLSVAVPKEASTPPPSRAVTVPKLTDSEMVALEEKRRDEHRTVFNNYEVVNEPERIEKIMKVLGGDYSYKASNVYDIEFVVNWKLSEKKKR